jgi:hypothetical protein
VAALLFGTVNGLIAAHYLGVPQAAPGTPKTDWVKST